MKQVTITEILNIVEQYPNYSFTIDDKVDNNYYSIGAAISIIIFIVTSAISLGVYIFSPKAYAWQP